MQYVYQPVQPGVQPSYPGQYQVVQQQPQGQLEQLRAAQYQQQPMQVVQQAPPPQQQSSGGIIWVQGEEGAKAYLVAPGSSVLLMDSEAQKFYIKSADASGMPMPLRVFAYEEHTNAGPRPAAAEPAKQQPAPDYVTRAELDAVMSQLAELETRMAHENHATTSKKLYPVQMNKGEN